MTVRVNITPVGGNCGISGQGTFDILTSLGGAKLAAMTITEGDPDTYRLALDGGLSQIAAVLGDCPANNATSNGRAAPWPLLGTGLLPFTQTPVVRSDRVFDGSATGTQPGTDDGYRWTWSLRG